MFNIVVYCWFDEAHSPAMVHICIGTPASAWLTIAKYAVSFVSRPELLCMIMLHTLRLLRMPVIMHQPNSP